MCFWCRDENGMVVVILSRESVTIDAGFKGINCGGICGGKLFYGKIVLEKKLYLEALILV